MKALLFAAALAAISSSVLAEEAPAQPQGQAAPQPVKATEPAKEKMICTREAETGSIRVKKVCRPASQANTDDRRERDSLDMARQLQNAR